MVTKFFLIPTQDQDIKSLGLQRWRRGNLSHISYLHFICDLPSLLISLYFNLSSTTSPSITDVMYPSPINKHFSSKVYKDDDKSNHKRKLRQRIFYLVALYLKTYFILDVQSMVQMVSKGVCYSYFAVFIFCLRTE